MCASNLTCRLNWRIPFFDRTDPSVPSIDCGKNRNTQYIVFCVSALCRQFQSTWTMKIFRWRDSLGTSRKPRDIRTRIIREWREFRDSSGVRGLHIRNDCTEINGPHMDDVFQKVKTSKRNSIFLIKIIFIVFCFALKFGDTQMEAELKLNFNRKHQFCDYFFSYSIFPNYIN